MLRIPLALAETWGSKRKDPLATRIRTASKESTRGGWGPEIEVTAEEMQVLRERAASLRRDPETEPRLTSAANKLITDIGKQLGEANAKRLPVQPSLDQREADELRHRQPPTDDVTETLGQALVHEDPPRPTPELPDFATIFNERDEPRETMQLGRVAESLSIQEDDPRMRHLHDLLNNPHGMMDFCHDRATVAITKLETLRTIVSGFKGNFVEAIEEVIIELNAIVTLADMDEHTR